METFGQRITALELIPLGGGVFEVSVDDELVFSKKTLGRHAQPGEILALLQERG